MECCDHLAKPGHAAGKVAHQIELISIVEAEIGIPSSNGSDFCARLSYGHPFTNRHNCEKPSYEVFRIVETILRHLQP
jgi:hypothetical protein